jgi:hypothetical protein
MYRWVILDTKEQVEKLTRKVQAVPSHDLSIEEIVSTVVACAMNDVSLEEDFFDYKLALGKRLVKLPLPEVHRIVRAIEKFASFLFKKIRELHLHSKHGVLWYEFADLFHGSIVLKSIVTMEERL